MNHTFTLPWHRYRCCCFIFCFFILLSQLAVAQPVRRVYASNDDVAVSGRVNVSLDALQTAALNTALSGGLLNTLANIQDRNNAKDASPRTYSTLTITAANINLLGLNAVVGGVAEQTLIFTGPDLPTATTPVSIKVGSGSSLVGLLDGLSIQAMNGNVPVGPVISQSSGNLAAVLNGTNQQEITFVPGVPYNGVRIRLTAEGSLLAAGAISTLQLFHAYFLQPATGINCDAPIDVLAGVVGTVAALGGVTDEWNAIDGDVTTYATMTSGANVSGTVRHTTIFPGPSVAGDTVRFLVSVPGALVEAQLLTGITIETANGTTSNGTVDASSGLLGVRLLDGGTNQYAISYVPPQVFDRATINLGGLLNALATIRLHEVNRVIQRPQLSVNGVAGNAANACPGVPINFAIVNAQPGVTYNWYTDPVGGTGTPGNTYSAGPLAPGTYTFYADATRAGCTNPSGRTAVTVTVLPAGTVAALTVNGGAGGNTCPDPGGNVTITATSTGITNPVYYLYSGATLVASNSTGVFTVAVTPGTSYTYTAGVSGDGLCETVAADRKSIAFTVNALPQAPVLDQTGTITIRTGQTLRIEASSPDAVSYAWYKDGTPVAGVTGAVLEIANVTATNAGQYIAEAVNAAGCRSASAAVTVVVTGFQTWMTVTSSNPDGKAHAGDELTYTINVRNTGSAPLASTDVSGPVPANTIYLAGSGGTLNGNIVNLTVPPVAPGAVGSVTYKVKVNPDLTGVSNISNLASVTNGGATIQTTPEDPQNPANPASPLPPGTPTVIAVAQDLGFQAWKTVSSSNPDGRAHAGDVLTYTIRVRNTGSATQTSLTVSDPVPANTTYVAGSGGTLSGNTVQFTIPSVAVGAVASVSFQVRVNNDLTGVASVSNQASVSNGTTTVPTGPEDPQNPVTPGSPQNPTSPTVIPTASDNSFQAWKTVSSSNPDGNAHAGDVLTYTIRVRNTGSTTQTNLTVSDPMPANTTYVAGSGGTLSGNTVQFTIPSVAVGAIANVSFQVRVNNNLTGVTSVSNQASVGNGTTTIPTGPEDPQNPVTPGSPQNPTAPTVIPVVQTTGFQTWMTVTSTNPDGKAHAGDELTYTIYVRNTGSSPLASTNVSGPVPANTTYLAGSGGTLNGNTVNLTVPPVAPGAVSNVSYKVKVNPDLTGVNNISNLASVTSGATTVQTTPEDPQNPANPGSPLPPGTPTVIAAVADNNFQAWKTVASTSTDGKAHAGDVLTYTINIRNTGSSAITNLTVTDPVPANTTYVAGSGGTLSGNTVRFTIPTVAFNAVTSVSFKVKVNSDLTGVTSINNQASVGNGVTTVPTGPEDPQNPTNPGNPQNPAGPTQLPVINNSDVDAVLTVSSSSSDGKAHPGDELTYTIRVTNTGSTALTNVSVNNVVPQFTSYIAGSGGNLAGNAVQFAIPSIPVEGSQEVTFKVRANLDLSGVSQITNVATITAGTLQEPTNTVSVEVIVGDDLFIPNTFTPNNDGKNDQLFVYGSNISGLKFRVYNQWGQLIFQGLSQAEGWDGTHGGVLQPSGVYVYYADVAYNNGRKQIKKGTISLLR